ncbi:MAG: 16S rRNA (cytidine(1402)-2'-O)-methyltransferase [Gammaproteobacteria bacterium]|nr:16S rRNA (cytidine(1402)-2'-O)-methyltransferase [Gammaproteobacteria bacterium]
MQQNGQLFIVPTPIGNLGDFSSRAIQTLQTVDLIAAEDTRHSQRLLHHFQISKPLISLHEHNESKHTHKIIALLQEGKSIALLSDAGTPLISDPGQTLVAQAHLAQIKVVPLPGPCAAITALSAAGFECTEFTFIGFLPAKSSQRLSKLKALSSEFRTLIFYETPHRIVATLEDMRTVLGDTRRVCFARELTKFYETICVRTLGELTEWVQQNSTQQQGEYVLILEGKPEEKQISSVAEHETLLGLLLTELPIKKAVQLATQLTGARKNALYDLALSLTQKKHTP